MFTKLASKDLYSAFQFEERRFFFSVVHLCGTKKMMIGNVSTWHTSLVHEPFFLLPAKLDIKGTCCHIQMMTLGIVQLWCSILGSPVGSFWYWFPRSGVWWCDKQFVSDVESTLSSFNLTQLYMFWIISMHTWMCFFYMYNVFKRRAFTLLFGQTQSVAVWSWW